MNADFCGSDKLTETSKDLSAAPSCLIRVYPHKSAASSIRRRPPKLEIEQAESRHAKLLSKSLQQQVVKRLLINCGLHLLMVRFQLFLHFPFDRCEFFSAHHGTNRVAQHSFDTRERR